MRKSNKVIPRSIILTDVTLRRINRAGFKKEVANIVPAVIITLIRTRILIFLSRVSYIRESIAALKSIYKRNKILKRLDSELRSSSDSKGETLVILTDASSQLIFNT
jgi:hypothetical protein